MNKRFIALLVAFFPLFAMAAGSSMNLTPPPSDYSVAFLGNLFGVVDGVLHGTGSQIMGAIFTVFNSAVLALGGIVIMYTLIVGTMNTAHEGEMLGHKWSSIWIPVRSTTGLALLIPKASGYCLMQIFVMWVVVQGVGAADKVWAGALDYLNRGGVIIKATMEPRDVLNEQTNSLPRGASSILVGQVCMLGLQKQLEAVRKEYLALASATPSLGPCGPDKATNGMNDFCSTAVPDLLSTFDAIDYQKGNSSSTLSMPVPFFGNNKTSPYAFLEGVCGTISWKRLKVGSFSEPPPSTSMGKNGRIKFKANYQAAESDLDQQELISLSRASAVQQMYINYQLVAQTMVNNDPQIGTPSTSTTTPACRQAKNVFGVPYSASTAMPCDDDSKDCFLWQGGYVCTEDGNKAGTAGAPIFTGAELQNGILDYSGVMMATLNLINQLKEKESGNKARQFIDKAKKEGWLSAGSYFFDLVKLNGSATSSVDLIDKNSGLDSSDTSMDKAWGAFAESSSTCTGKYSQLCTWLTAGEGFTKGRSKIKVIDNLLGSKDKMKIPPDGGAVTGSSASTVYGFVTNSLIIQIPGQPTMTPPKLVNNQFPKMAPASTRLSLGSPACGGVKIIRTICIGRVIMQGIYSMFAAFSTLFTNILGVWINNMIIILISIPLASMQDVFVVGMKYLTDNPGVNPIVALAKMGVHYINAPANLYVGMITQILAVQFIPFFIGQVIGAIMIALLAMASPLIISWMGVMTTIGFTTAFYIPFLPYMIFTFGVIAWLMAVIEAMVAAPIVALAITHPEGEGIMGNKGETALMILMNVFLRPALMIIGYISAIALCYVSVWIINTGFSHVLSFIKGDNYKGWAGLYVLFFSVVIYTTMYVTVAQKSFNLIHLLPDHVLRWIGGHPEQAGQEAAGWAGESQKHVEKGGEKSDAGQSGVMEKTIGKASKTKGISGTGGTTASGSS